jgi:hypothetical protein
MGVGVGVGVRVGVGVGVGLPRTSSTVIADPVFLRTSHTRTVLSQPQLMSTPASLGDQTRSSTLPL